MTSVWKRNCPNCRRECFYTRKSTMVEAERNNRRCSICSRYGAHVGMRGKRHTASSLVLLRESHIGQIAWNKGKKGIYSQQSLEKMRKCKLGIPLSKEHRQKSRKTQVAYLQRHKSRTSKSATKFLDILEQLSGMRIEREFPVDGRVFDGRIGRFLIEVDGRFWHSKPKMIIIDKEKERIAQDNGYLLRRFEVNDERDLGLVATKSRLVEMASEMCHDKVGW